MLEKVMELKRTPLYNEILSQGGRMVPFAGWEMPVQFTSVVEEHQSVRQGAGIFDISHMGIVLIKGKNAKDAFQRIVPTDLNRISTGEACYTLILNEKGGIIDDIIVYELDSLENNIEQLLIVINAACTNEDIAWFKKHLEPTGLSITHIHDRVLLALQGPKAKIKLESILKISLSNLSKFSHCNFDIQTIYPHLSGSIFISRTGYTGEDGFEIMMSKEAGKKLWIDLINKGCIPCGLGSRDTLRLEAGMHLYGNDINIKTTPFEAGLGWTIHLEMNSNFIGREALEQQAIEGIKVRMVGLELNEKAIARHGHKIFSSGKAVGEVTSGSWSPSLSKSIAMAYLPLNLVQTGNTIEIQIRNKLYEAHIVKRPFYRKTPIS